MNTTPISLQYLDGAANPEHFISDWGYGAANLRLISQAASLVTVRKVNGDPAGADPIPFMGQVVIWKDRTFGGGAFSGGVKIFQGRRTDIEGDADAQSRSVSMVFSDPWWDLENIIFRHYWKVRQLDGTFANQYFSRVNLFQNISAGVGTPWGQLTTAAQIAEIIAYAVTCGANVQLGTVDPAWTVPFYPVKAVFCADALLTCLKLIDDAVAYFDYSFTPPKLHFRQRANLTAKTLPYKGVDGHARKHKSSNIKPLPNLQVSEVLLEYQQTTTIDGKDYFAPILDVWPGGSTGLAIGAVIAPIDLRGATYKTVQGKLNVNAAIDPTTSAYWLAKKPDLKSSLIRKLSDGTAGVDVSGITITDAAGTAVSLATYPNELITGSLCPWMTLSGGAAVIGKKVTISATISYLRRTSGTNANSHSVVEKHPVSCKNVTLTNGVTGGYSALASADPGEGVPVGLAHNIYDANSTLQWEGTHEILEKSIYEIIGPGNCLNISGGNAAWTTMNAVITETNIDFYNGRTTVGFGPHKHLGPAELVEKIMLWRYRQIYENPNVRNTGASSGSDVELGEEVNGENTTQGIKEASLHSVITQPDGSANQFLTQINAGTGQFLMKTVDATGATVTAQPQVLAAMADLGAVGGVGRVAKWRAWTVCVDDGTGTGTFVKKTAWFLSTVAE